MTRLTYTAIDPGVAYEYAVLVNGQRIGRVRKQDAPTHPYGPTRKWVAEGIFHKSGFPTRQAAADWLLTWLR